MRREIEREKKKNTREKMCVCLWFRVFYGKEREGNHTDQPTKKMKVEEDEERKAVKKISMGVSLSFIKVSLSLKRRS